MPPFFLAQAADILSDVLGRRISHTVVSVEELMAYYSEMCGYPPEYANFVIPAELRNDAGAQESWWGRPDNLVGKETVGQWAERFKSKFSPVAS